MIGEPDDIDGECNARLFIADNFGDGSATMRCQLAPGHEGLHREVFERNGHPVTTTWGVDERRRCDHGCGQWEHVHGSQYDENAVTCPRDADDHVFADCAFCLPDRPPLTCDHCGKIHFYAEGHLRECAKKPFTCAICGESGVGNHDWPLGCPRQREIALGNGTADEFTGDLP